MSRIEPVTADLLRTMPLPEPKEGSKDHRGCALVIAGSLAVPGAPLLSANAALRAGAGKLQIATNAETAPGLGLAVPEAMLIGLPSDGDGGFDAQAARERLTRRTERCDGVLIGPGMVEGGGAVDLTAALLAHPSKAAYVLDAAAVCGLQAHAETLRAREGHVVITPHAGEAAQLLDCSREEIEADALAAGRAAARLLDAVAIMKGAETWIVEPGGTAWRYEGGGVGLATSGSGDVLAGLIVGLLARGATAAQAAVWGVYLHGEAGARLARSVGVVGFFARELAGEVPGLIDALR